jgi:hypothetical protein
MKLPLFVFAEDDLLMFEDATTLERYIESPDASAIRVFDSEGNEFRLTPVGKDGRERSQEKRRKGWLSRLWPIIPVQSCVLVPLRNSAQEFQALASEFIRTEFIAPVARDHMRLEEIVALLKGHLHYTK